LHNSRKAVNGVIYCVLRTKVKLNSANYYRLVTSLPVGRQQARLVRTT
jgi:hypothetical protein